MRNKTERVPLPSYEDEYVIGLVVFHQLHCLNVLRMAFYPGRYNTSMKKPDGAIDQGQWMHVDHCIESLHQSVTCHSDVSPVLFTWLKSKRILEPELEVVHKCRDFEKIRKWAFERFINLGNRRQHVPDSGRIADYTSLDPNPEDDLSILDPPKSWSDNTQDL